jgi:hypothetical protein
VSIEEPVLTDEIFDLWDRYQRIWHGYPPTDKHRTREYFTFWLEKSIIKVSFTPLSLTLS